MAILDKYSKQQIITGMLAIVGLAVAVYLIARGSSSDAPDSIERRSQTVTIRDTVTGDEWTMNRGQFERLLLTQDGMIDEKGGIPSQFSEGRPVGVLVDKSDWEETVRRINAMKQEYGSPRP